MFLLPRRKELDSGPGLEAEQTTLEHTALALHPYHSPVPREPRSSGGLETGLRGPHISMALLPPRRGKAVETDLPITACLVGPGGLRAQEASA